MIRVRHLGPIALADGREEISRLAKALHEHPLDRACEGCGGFRITGTPDLPTGVVRYVGSFKSGPFRTFVIETDDQRAIDQIDAAIAHNQQTDAYQRQPPVFRREMVKIDRKFFSSTQCEVEVFYDGRRLGQYGDTTSLDSRGDYRGLPDEAWHRLAMDRIAADHAAAWPTPPVPVADLQGILDEAVQVADDRLQNLGGEAAREELAAWDVIAEWFASVGGDTRVINGALPSDEARREIARRV